jgi:hypothetical protein
MTTSQPTASAADALTAMVAAALDGGLGEFPGMYSVHQVIAELLASGTVLEEWGARYHNPDGDVDTWRDTREKAERMIASRTRGGWRCRSSLIRRFVIVTAAQPVDPEETR